MRIFLPAGNHATLYNYTLQMRSALENDRLAQIEETYEKYGYGRRCAWLCEQAAGVVDGSHEGGNLAVAAFFAVRLLWRVGPCSL